MAIMIYWEKKSRMMSEEELMRKSLNNYRDIDSRYR